MKRCVIMWLLCAVPLPVFALTPDEFAFGYPLVTTGQASVYRLVLPAGLYSDVVHADLRDIRVFNAAHEVVPHSLRRPAQQQDAERAPQALPFYPFETALPDGKGPVAVQIHSDAHGTIVSVDSSVSLQDGRVVSSYLFDGTLLSNPPSRLQLSWSGGSTSQVLPVAVESSDDLMQWSPLASATLLRLNYAGHQLERNSIELPLRHYKYLRLRWPSSAQHTTLTEVQAYLPRSTTRPVDQWLEIAGQRSQETKPVYEFDTQAQLPVGRIDLLLSENNSLLEGVLLSRATKTAPWTRRYSGLFYRLQEQGAELHNEPVSMSINSDRYWRLEVTSDPAGLGDQPPQLRLGWLPHELFFLARGTGPFLLVVGSGVVTAPSAVVDQLLARLDADNPADLIGSSSPAARLVLGGPDRLQPLSPPFPWQQATLWGVLLLGVALLGGMAWRLYGQMSRK